MNLVLDIGNTGAKATVYDKGNIVRKSRLESCGSSIVETFIGDSDITGAIISSVVHDPVATVTLLENRGIKVHHLTYRSRFPFTVEYRTPETLGVDRLAAASGAMMYHPGNDLLVIDAGSAVTLDIVAGGAFLGGSISPGLSLRFRALNQFTGRLPLVSFTDKFSLPGNSTTDAIAGGVFTGLVFEINEYIRTFEKRYKSLITVITGGDGEKIASATDQKVKFYPDLVADGLNYLFDYNA